MRKINIYDMKDNEGNLFRWSLNVKKMLFLKRYCILNGDRKKKCFEGYDE